MSSNFDGVAAFDETPSSVPALSMRMPSRYTIGSFDMERLLVPRMRIRAPEPVSPLEGCTTTEGSRAASSSEKFCTGAFLSLATSMVAIVLPSCFFSTAAPVPVTTISSSAMTDSLRKKSWVAGCNSDTDTMIVWVANPIARICRRTLPSGTLTISYWPSRSVSVPIRVANTAT